MSAKDTILNAFTLKFNSNMVTVRIKEGREAVIQLCLKYPIMQISFFHVNVFLVQGYWPTGQSLQEYIIKSDK